VIAINTSEKKKLLVKNEKQFHFEIDLSDKEITNALKIVIPWRISGEVWI
jgi:NADPH-dependent curcumin reductase CurA